MKEVKICLVDDSDAVRQQLQTALSRIDGSKLVGMLACGHEATKLVKALKPDVVVIDVVMPEGDGLEVLKEIRNEVPQAEIIVFTANPSMALKGFCLEAGADLYLHKTQFKDLIEICSEELAQV